MTPLASRKRILVGGLVRQELPVLAAHLATLKAQEVPHGTDLRYVWVNDADEDHRELTEAMLKEHFPDCEIHPAPPKAPNDYAVGDRTHHWSVSAFDRMARMKQVILDQAVEDRYDGVCLIDTDILLDRRTIASLLSVGREVVSAVFWTEWQQGAPSLGPNVWLRHPYEQSGGGVSEDEFWSSLLTRQLTRVAGGGACIYISTEAIQRGCVYFPRLDGLPQHAMWQGEDRSFAIRCQRNHIQMWADPWPDLYHAYHKSQREVTLLKEWLDYFATPSQDFAKYGDLVAFTLESLEDPALVGQLMPVRGRLGSKEMLPELEVAVGEMKPGEERIIPLRFPRWFPLGAINRPGLAPVQYRGTEKAVRVKMVDVKPHGSPPVVADEVFRGLEGYA